MDKLTATAWAGIVSTLRVGCGLSQSDFAELLGVDQTTVSRWERGLGLPAPRYRRKMRDMQRSNPAGRADALTRLRVKMSAWPSTLLGPGARLIERSRAASMELSLEELGPGVTLYGRFGAEVDEQVSDWERSGIFAGELAMTISLNRIQSPEGTVYFRGMDTPHVSSTGEIWCLCELRRLSEAGYADELRQMGARLVSIPYDRLS